MVAICFCIKRCCCFVTFFVISMIIFLELSFLVEDLMFSGYTDHAEGYVERIAKPLEDHTILFAACGVSLSETTRMLVVAEYLKDHYPMLNIVFYSFGGVGSFNYTYLIEESGFEYHVLEPVFESEEEVQLFYEIDRGEAYGVGQMPYLGESSKGLIKQFFPKNAVNKMIMYVFSRIWYQTTNFKIVAKEYGVNPKIRSIYDLLQGTTTLVTEVPQLVGIPEEQLEAIYGKGNKFVGMLFAKIRKEVPPTLQEKIDEVKENGRKILYFAMGSSGNSEVVRTIMKSLDKAFKSDDLDEIGLVISPTRRLLDKFDPEEAQRLIDSLEKRIQVTDLLPAHTINSLCDYAIIHGGQGTVQTAISTGLPFVGVPAQFEQENNIKIIVESIGSAIFASKASVLENGEVVIEKLKQLMENPIHHEKAQDFLKVVEKYNAEEKIANLIIEEVRNVNLFGQTNKLSSDQDENDGL